MYFTLTKLEPIRDTALEAGEDRCREAFRNIESWLPTKQENLYKERKEFGVETDEWQQGKTKSGFTLITNWN